jgi:hypothetical protein
MAMATTACISPKSFVDPSYPKVAYEELKRPQQPLKITMTSQFQRNGAPLPAADATLKDNSERVLRASGLMVPVTEGAEGTINIVVNNIADTGAAAAKGFGTGLTFGLVGTTVTDAYEMTITINIGGKTFTRSAVKHAFHTAIGNTATPVGLETVPPNVAFQRVFEQMLLRVLKEYQVSPEYSHLRVPARAA